MGGWAIGIDISGLSGNCTSCAPGDHPGVPGLVLHIAQAGVGLHGKLQVIAFKKMESGGYPIRRLPCMVTRAIAKPRLQGCAPCWRPAGHSCSSSPAPRSCLRAGRPWGPNTSGGRHCNPGGAPCGWRVPGQCRAACAGFARKLHLRDKPLPNWERRHAV